MLLNYLAKSKLKKIKNNLLFYILLNKILFVSTYYIIIIGLKCQKIKAEVVYQKKILLFSIYNQKLINYFARAFLGGDFSTGLSGAAFNVLAVYHCCTIPKIIEESQ